MNLKQGDKVKFALPIDLNNFKILIGKVVSVLDETNQVKIEWCKDHFNNEFENTLVKMENIIENVEDFRAGYPLEYIEDFTGSEFHEVVIELFMQEDKSYIFQDWLNKRLFDSTILYVKEKNHYVVEYHGRLFDIRGEVTEKYKNDFKEEHRYEGDWYHFN